MSARGRAGPAGDQSARAFEQAAAVLRAERHAGRVPDGWRHVVECGGCGPVWLWAPFGQVLACPWCWNRADGLPVPRAAGPP